MGKKSFVKKLFNGFKNEYADDVDDSNSDCYRGCDIDLCDIDVDDYTNDDDLVNPEFDYEMYNQYEPEERIEFGERLPTCNNCYLPNMWYNPDKRKFKCRCCGYETTLSDAFYNEDIFDMSDYEPIPYDMYDGDIMVCCDNEMWYNSYTETFKCIMCGKETYEPGRVKEDVDDDDSMPECCAACGGPYPDCMSSCKLFDD